MQTIEWDDVTLLGRRVLIFDEAHREAGRARAGLICGPGTEPGCVCIAVFRREDLDDNAALVRYYKNTLLVRRISDRPPGNGRIALLVGEGQPAKQAHAEAYGGRPSDLPKGGQLKDPELVLDGGAKKPEPGDEAEWEELEEGQSKASSKTTDEDGDDERPIPKTKSESLIGWPKSQPLREVSQPIIVDDDTVDFAIEISDKIMPFVRIKWVNGPDDSQSGYVLRLADSSGKMTMTMGSAVSYCKTESEIEALVKIGKLLIKRVSGSKTLDEANHLFKAAIDDFRSGKISV